MVDWVLGRIPFKSAIMCPLDAETTHKISHFHDEKKPRCCDIAVFEPPVSTML
jgi:hypothetical protein